MRQELKEPSINEQQTRHRKAGQSHNPARKCSTWELSSRNRHKLLLILANKHINTQPPVNKPEWGVRNDCRAKRTAIMRPWNIMVNSFNYNCIELNVLPVQLQWSPWWWESWSRPARWLPIVATRCPVSPPALGRTPSSPGTRENGNYDAQRWVYIWYIGYGIGLPWSGVTAIDAASWLGWLHAAAPVDWLTFSSITYCVCTVMPNKRSS